MPTNTYVALDRVTIGTATNIVEFTSIPATYTDLVIVGSGSLASNSTLAIKLNNDASALYSRTEVYGDGSTAASYRESNQSTQNFALWDTTGSNFILQIQNYANSSINKTILTRYNRPSSILAANVVLYRSNTAISRVTITGGANFTTGSTFTLYGIKAESVSPAVKATGGAIYADSTYYYHVFAATGVFTPLSSLTADVLVVAGGGGGCTNATSGGGGAGGLLTFTGQSLSATAYTCTIGAGGATAGAPGGITGADSQFGALTLVKGGGGGGATNTAGKTGGSGGGGGGGSSAGAGGAATSGQGFAGGAGYQPGSDQQGGGGGGGGAVGQAGAGAGQGVPQSGGNGGIGLTNTFINAIGTTTGTGQLVSGNYYFAGGGGAHYGGVGGFGGGGGGTTAGAALSGTANTGGGGKGGGSGLAGSGGSGIVIVRYLKA